MLRLGRTSVEMQIPDGTIDPEGQSFSNRGQLGSRTESLSFSMPNTFVLAAGVWMWELSGSGGTKATGENWEQRNVRFLVKDNGETSLRINEEQTGSRRGPIGSCNSIGSRLEFATSLDTFADWQRRSCDWRPNQNNRLCRRCYR